MSETATADQAITLTPAAVGEVKTLLARPENSGKHLRLFIEQGGCSGMQYGMVFDEPRDGDLVSCQEDLRVLTDAISVNYLRGAIVDFSDALTGGGFKITNPNAKQSCGCGKSFEA